VWKNEIWFSLFGEWFERFMQPDSDDRIGYVKVNGAVPGKLPNMFLRRFSELKLASSNGQRLL
jgi:hypothetical protein